MALHSSPSRLIRKWRKLRRDPVRFFAQARSPLLRKLGLWSLAGRDGEAREIFDNIVAGNEALGKWTIPMPRPDAPTDAQWIELAEAAATQPVLPPVVDVIMPVYGGSDDTLTCLYSVLTTKQQTLYYEVIVIDDAGLEPALIEKLKELAATGLFTLIQSDRNLGFVRSANRCMMLHTDCDVILMNSDTVVYGVPGLTWQGSLYNFGLLIVMLIIN